MPFDSFTSANRNVERNFAETQNALTERANRVEAAQAMEEYAAAAKAVEAPLANHKEQERRYREQVMIDPSMADPMLEERLKRQGMVVEMDTDFQKLDLAMSTLAQYQANPMVVEQLKPMAEAASQKMTKQLKMAQAANDQSMQQQQATAAAFTPAEGMPPGEPQMMEPTGRTPEQAELENDGSDMEGVEPDADYASYSDDELRLEARRKDITVEAMDAVNAEMDARSDDGLEPGVDSGFGDRTWEELQEHLESDDGDERERAAKEIKFRVDYKKSQPPNRMGGYEGDESEGTPDRPGMVPTEERDSMGARVKGAGKTGFEYMTDSELARQGRKDMSVREEQEWNTEVERRYKGQP